MKKTKVLLMLIAFIIILTLTACSNINTGGTGSLTARLTDNVTGNNTDITIKDDDVNEEFTLLNDSGQKISSVDNVYTITEGGSYTAQGKLENGQIYINASNLDVEITLLGVLKVYIRELAACNRKLFKCKLVVNLFAACCLF